MRKIFYLVFLGCFALLSGCTSVNKWMLSPGESYQNIQRAKLTNTAFADDYKDKLVTFKARFMGIQERPMIFDFNPKEYLGITLYSCTVKDCADSAPPMFYNVAQKKNYEMISAITDGNNVDVSGRTFLLKDGTLGIYVHNIKDMGSGQ